MNSIVPGSGDLAKAAIDAARGKVLNAADRFAPASPGSKILTRQSPAIVTPRHLSAKRALRSSVLDSKGMPATKVIKSSCSDPGKWTVPPEVPLGWEEISICGPTHLYRKGDAYIMWDIVAGRYTHSHNLGCRPETFAWSKFRERCTRGSV